MTDTTIPAPSPVSDVDLRQAPLLYRRRWMGVWFLLMLLWTRGEGYTYTLLFIFLDDIAYVAFVFPFLVSIGLQTLSFIVVKALYWKTPRSFSKTSLDRLLLSYGILGIFYFYSFLLGGPLWKLMMVGYEAFFFRPFEALVDLPIVCLSAIHVSADFLLLCLPAFVLAEPLLTRTYNRVENRLYSFAFYRGLICVLPWVCLFAFLL